MIVAGTPAAYAAHRHKLDVVERGANSGVPFDIGFVSG
jgi:hypothetical protein